LNVLSTENLNGVLIKNSRSSVTDPVTKVISHSHMKLSCHALEGGE